MNRPTSKCQCGEPVAPNCLYNCAACEDNARTGAAHILSSVESASGLRLGRQRSSGVWACHEVDLPNELEAKLREGLDGAWFRPTGSEPRVHLLHGPNGTGKSHVAAAMVREACEHVGARFVPAVELIARIQAGYGDHGSSPLEIVREMNEVPVLALDDLATERLTDDALHWVCHVLDVRWSEMRPTIVTTNYDPAELTRRYGARFASRACSGRVVAFSGKDWRVG